MSIFKKEALFSFFLFTFLAASLAFTISNLYQQSIRLDESQSIWFSTKPIINVLQIAAEDVHMPLYYVLLHFWLQIFGANVPVARTLSLVFFLLTLPVLFLMAKEASNYKAAVLSVVLFSLSPFVVWFSSEARMYTLFIFITTLSSLYFLRFVRSQGKNYRTAYLLTTIAGLYTHYFFWFVLGTQGLYVLFFHLTKTLKYRQIGRSWFESITSPSNVILSFMLNSLVAVFFVAPWFVYFLSQGAGSNYQPQIPTPTSYTVVQTFVNFFFGFQAPSVSSLFIALWPLFTILIFLLFSVKRNMAQGETSYFLFLVIIPIAVAFVVSFVRPVFLPRYFIFVTPALFYLIAQIMVSLTGRTYSTSVIILVLMMFGFLTYQTVSADTPAKENYARAANYLKDRAEPQDVVAVTPPFTIYPLEYYYRGSARLTTIPEWDRYSEGSIPEFTLEALKERLDLLDQTYDEIFIIFSYDQGYEKEIRDYMDNHYHLVEDLEFSYDLTLRVYKLRYYE